MSVWRRPVGTRLAASVPAAPALDGPKPDERRHLSGDSVRCEALRRALPDCPNPRYATNGSTPLIWAQQRPDGVFNRDSRALSGRLYGNHWFSVYLGGAAIGTRLTPPERPPRGAGGTHAAHSVSLFQTASATCFNGGNGMTDVPRSRSGRPAGRPVSRPRSRPGVASAGTRSPGRSPPLGSVPP